MFELAAAPFRTQYELLCELMTLPQLRRCCIDAGGLGMQLAEQAVESFGGHRVEAVTFTVESKSQMATALRLAVEGGKIAIPQDDRIVNDWHSIRRELTEAGHFRLVAPRTDGSHADRFWAAALAIRAAQSAITGTTECLKIKPIQFAQQGTW
jgi:phage FluMu gp28-like protein